MNCRPNAVNCLMSFSEFSVSFYIYITFTIFVFHLATYSLFWALLLSVVSKHPPFCLYRKRPEAAEVIKRLERNPSCQGLPMISFLLLPMQRITRLPLLVDAICHRLEPDTPKHRSAGKALDALNKVDPSYKQVPLTNRFPYKVGSFSTSCAVRSWTPKKGLSVQHKFICRYPHTSLLFKVLDIHNKVSLTLTYIITCTDDRNKLNCFCL